MKVFQALAPGRGGFCELPDPEPRNGEVVVRVRRCGVCGTDYALFSGDSAFIRSGQATYPIRLGHEWSGTVEKVGAGVTKVKQGDRVVGDNYVSCGRCAACLRGDYNNCSGRSHVGTINPCWPGAFAEFYVAPERHVYKLADNVSLREAALCEPFSVAYGGIKKAEIGPSTTVAVIGTGCIGMAAAALALARGAGRVYMIGRNRFKLERAATLGVTGTVDSTLGDPAKQLGELTGGSGADVILECSGNPETVPQALRAASQKALIALIGFYERPLDGFAIDTVVSKELRLTGIMGEYGNLEAVSKLMAEKDMRPAGIITGEMPFSRCAEALAPADPHRVIKTIISMDGE